MDTSETTGATSRDVSAASCGQGEDADRPGPRVKVLRFSRWNAVKSRLDRSTQYLVALDDGDPTRRGFGPRQLLVMALAA